MKLTLGIYHQDGTVAMGQENNEPQPLVSANSEQCYLATQGYLFQDGDVICVTVDTPDSFLMVRLATSLKEDLVFVPHGEINYLVDLSANRREAQSSALFTGTTHYLSVRQAEEFEIKNYRNLSENTHDQKDFTGAYPHAYANVETRNDAVFFACNAIDGILASRSHGAYPFQSWGINQQADAALTIDFGRQVQVDRVGFCLRADFPHDNYWEKVTLKFGEDDEETFSLAKTGAMQYFTFSARTVTAVTLQNLIPATDPSPPHRFRL